MHPLIREHLPQIVELCRRHRVRRLTLFGSALRDDFDPSRSDVDLALELEPRPPAEYGDAYFELLEELESLLGRRVDLVERQAIRNPYLLRAIERSEVPLYDAA